MELLDAFADFEYPNDIGHGVYDIHAPCTIERRNGKASGKGCQSYSFQSALGKSGLWFKTRGWDETEKALIEMVNAAKEMQKEFASIV